MKLSPLGVLVLGACATTGQQQEGFWPEKDPERFKRDCVGRGGQVSYVDDGRDVVCVGGTEDPLRLMERERRRMEREIAEDNAKREAAAQAEKAQRTPRTDANGVVVLPDNVWTGSGVTIDPNSVDVLPDSTIASSLVEALPATTTEAPPPPTDKQIRAAMKKAQTPAALREFAAWLDANIDEYDNSMNVYAEGKKADVLVFVSPHCGEGKGALYEMMEDKERRFRLFVWHKFKRLECRGGRFREVWLPEQPSLASPARPHSCGVRSPQRSSPPAKPRRRARS